MLMNSKKFGLIIEGIVKEKKIPYMDAVLQYCDDNDIDTATIGPLINKSLKEKDDVYNKLIGIAAKKRQKQKKKIEEFLWLLDCRKKLVKN